MALQWWHTSNGSEVAGRAPLVVVVVVVMYLSCASLSFSSFLACWATQRFLCSSRWQHKMPRYLSFFLLFAAFRSSSAFPNPAHYLFNHPLAAGTNETQHLLVRAGEPQPLTTCGYLDGSPDHFRTANPGYNCRFDTANSLWGYCPTTVVRAVDCGLAGACIDQHDCTKGCGNLQGKLTTFTCDSSEYCSTAVLALATDQSYSYIACGRKSGIDNYFVSPTAATTTTTPPPQDIKTTQPKPQPTAAPEPEQTSRTPATTSSSTGNTSGGNGGSTSSGNGGSTTSPAPTSSGTVTAASSTATPGGSGANNTPAIIGGVIGGIALLCIFGLAAIYLIRRDKKATAKRNQEKRRTELSTSPNTEDKKDRSHRATGGWGPRELPAQQSDPVELPS
ncbi:hypothetical protein NLG97_g10705 [Lecanicillium saksenae]|uniref:Uncharacterized protein n=1 Tax=Lecanicillium saksenae TaxID=468837 RepID=A0ACC1QED7_9HYPO|nr:hypothetical protein NLG97_g10705 [Lecanicillium saksenae]